MFINLSNHPSEKWEENQRAAAAEYGEIRDLPFPQVPPGAGGEELRGLVGEYFGQIEQLLVGEKDCSAIHLMGEPSFCFMLANRLLRDRYRVLMSTTQRIASEEGGVKTSVFRFVRFREYEAASYREAAKKKIPVDGKDRDSMLMLVVLTLLEFLVVWSRYSLHSWGEFFGSFVFLPLYVVLLSVLGWLFVRARRYGRLKVLSPLIITKLLGNAVAPRRLTVLYLLVFVVHLAWLTNGSYAIFAAAGTPFAPGLLFPLAVAAFGLFCLVCFFPGPANMKDGDAVEVFVSGMSVIGDAWWGDMLQRLNNEASGKSDIEYRNNIMPLVRSLVLHRENKGCMMEILRSDKQIFRNFELPENIKRGILDKCKDTEGNPDGDAMDTLRREFLTVVTFLRSGESEDERKERSELYEDYGVARPGQKYSDAEYLKFLTVVIKIFAKFEFPEKADMVRELKINFTKPCGYDCYSDCYDTMNAVVSRLDDPKHEIVFNLTPGTALVSSVMTLLAIDGDRKLYYHDQNSDEKEIAKLMTVVDKSCLSLENLLSQALENLPNT